MSDPYVSSRATILEAPASFRERIRFLGPGFILSACIVGSGELIATTRLGAEAGWVTLWVILVSCLVKVVVQLEFGKHAIYTGKTTMQALNELPGPRIGKANWSIWSWLVLMLIKLLQVGGVVGGTALVLQMVWPQVPLALWCYALAVAVSLLIFRGTYGPIERISILLIVLFSMFTLISVVAVQYTPFRITGEEILGGLSFKLPPEAVLVAIGAFGITGVGGDEIMAYNYWLLEKGYGRYTGPPEQSDVWIRRARGWIRVMTLDALLSMGLYTVTTAAFYVLGAAILHSQGLLPEGMEMVSTLSQLYTQSMGPWAGTLFLGGAFVVLFSTLFGALALWTRLFSDAFAQIGFLDYRNKQQRHRSISIVAWILPVMWATLFLLVQLPALMVIIGGVATTGILIIVVFATIHYRYRQLPSSLSPTNTYDVLLWLSITAIVGVAVYGIYQVIF